MATAILFSQHSSNPLEVGSSDPRNAHYRRTLNAANKRRAQESFLSSDDPLNGGNVEGMKRYHEHLSHVLPTFTAQKQRPVVYVDLDEDMESDDDFNLTGGAERHHDASHDEEGHETELRDDLRNDTPDSPGQCDEELTIHLKSPEERQEIEEEIADLERAVPQLSTDYKLIDRLGTGTFSSVYKAVDLHYHDKWYNDPWHGHHPPSSSAYYQSVPRPKDSKVFVAIKRIYVTSSPERIRNEISIMEDCRACRHTSQLITAFRQADQVVAIMPYQRNDDFREFFRDLPIPAIKAYLRCMFRALRDIHSRAIIHRDVKPANFLFDPRTGVGTLCDFGLASRIESVGPMSGACFHTSATREHPHGITKSRNEFNADEIKGAQLNARHKSSLLSEKVGYPEKDARPISKANRAGTRGFRAPEVLLKCGDQTGAIDVWAVGMILLFFLTGKFPLFQSSDDIEALMEIATIIGSKKMEKVATLHSRTFATNVPSITSEGISWREFVERQNPTLYEPQEPDPRYWPYNLVNHPSPPADSSACHYNIQQSSASGSRQELAPPPPSSSSSPPPLYFPRSSSPISPTISPTSLGPRTLILSPSQHRAEIDSAFDLLEQLMQPESIKRITPENVLAHLFLRDDPPFMEETGFFEDEAPDDDEFVPHRWGEEGGAVCREWHFKDEVTDVPCVKVWVHCGCGCGELFEEIMTLEAGEGVAIGRQPCEIHEQMEYY